MKAAEDETRLRETGRKIFAGEADFKWASTAIDNLPPMNSVEIAFAGRSNVGKSSLVNALTNRKTLARTSHTPGRTQQLNFFDIGGHFMLVDMPGYGYAAVSKAKVEAWTDVIVDYLKGRANLARVYVLIDGRHGVKDVDRDVMNLLDTAAVSYALVLTKHDEVKKAEGEKILAATRLEIAKRPAAYPEIIFTSSRTGDGIPDLRTAIARLLEERGS
ncbi:MAG: ribosome biogenesis GTP-binding protein YihA/YsxC [Hyphomicrobiales bacterium]|jgi:GTP-binding protein|nr:ribosome biogenesis GTP-binding protein YihA/YsxC [Hyphomicrobiales bacterium]